MEKSYPHVKRHNDLTLNHMGNITLFRPYFHIYIMTPIPIGYGPNPLRVDPIFLQNWASYSIQNHSSLMKKTAE